MLFFHVLWETGDKHWRCRPDNIQAQLHAAWSEAPPYNFTKTYAPNRRWEDKKTQYSGWADEKTKY